MVVEVRAVSDGASKSVTVLLREWRNGDRAALDALLPRVYDEIRRVAGAYLRRESPGHTLQPTELVSEAFVRLMAGEQPEWSDRVHFFAVAARHMRHILVDHARRRRAGKRGGGEGAVTLDLELAGAHRPAPLVALDDALKTLAAVDERRAAVVELHFFGGMTHAEIATALAVSDKTVERDLRLAESWLATQLRSAE